MLARLTSRNRLTLPKAIVSAFPEVSYFDVATEGGRIVLSPVRLNQGDAAREKLAELGITEADVEDAVAWTRRSS